MGVERRGGGGGDKGRRERAERCEWGGVGGGLRAVVSWWGRASAEREGREVSGVAQGRSVAGTKHPRPGNGRHRERSEGRGG